MASLVPSGSHTHQRLPSIPATLNEEDLAGGAWTEVDHDDVESPPPSSTRKGKERELNPVRVESPEEMNGNEEEDEESPDTHYPPTNDEEEESRKVEENLKRWELEERMRRKAARVSTSGSTAPSVVGQVGRRASLLWTGRKSNRDSKSLGIHKAVNQDEFPLDDIDGSPAASMPSSPTPDTFDQRSARSSISNPFADHHRSAVMDPSSLPPTPAARAEKRKTLDSTAEEPEGTGGGDDRPILQATNSFSGPSPKPKVPPPPMPFDIPPPRTPPPRVSTPPIGHPPEPTPPPVVDAAEREADSEADSGPPTRWWTDWLCGCREGPDRGGDNQAGRTNPFE
ncbi:hypothetical protein BD410DRAFT_895689 [Rickenella mellea]|uniref:Uncharacterized protein n=1 Tax=Rickenella mellea TaxID=50990 RepID=A0A4Y7QG10_9AGAM|nr:hypothetical protein BD410DRAFT_895689 [Rickenella mellea]